jgi:DNA-binding LacI/PurR family transcriptional regulator
MSLLASRHDRQFTPKYVGLARDLAREIARKPMEVGDRLGTEQEIGDRFGLSRVTVRQALDVLEKGGYVLRQRARGTFVARKIESVEPFGLVGDRVLLVCSNEQRRHSDEDSAFCTVLRAMEQSLARRHFTAQLLTVGQSPRSDRQRLQSVLAQDEPRAALTIGPCLESFADLFARIPVVTSCSFYRGSFPWVGVDIAQVCRDAIAYLLERGHRQIAMLCGSWIDGEAFASFSRGYRQAMAQANIQPDRLLMVHAYPGESLEELAIETLSSAQRPTAVFCENSRICQSVIKAASILERRIPDDLSIVGYGQNVIEIQDPVPITAYVPETAKVGELAVDLLCSLIAGADSEQNALVVPGRILERSSVTAPPLRNS